MGYEYCISGKKPVDIPDRPNVTYADAGWAGWGDWLGTGTVATYLRHYRSFKKARAFVRRLGLKSRDEWGDYCMSGRKPADIPTKPDRVYANEGWDGLGDWLGTNRRRVKGWRPFKDARAFVRRLGFQSRTEWADYCKSGKKPNDIPAKPDRVYSDSGWAGWGDWLGLAVR
jgi:hypothetical protein